MAPGTDGAHLRSVARHSVLFGGSSPKFTTRRIEGPKIAPDLLADELGSGADSDARNPSSNEQSIVPSVDKDSSFLDRFWAQTSLVPIVLYSPETSVMFGVGTLTILDLEGADPDRPSSVSVFGMYTLNHQSAAVAVYELRGAGTDMLFSSISDLSIGPISSYGIGNGTNKGIAIDDASGGTRNYVELTDQYIQLESEYQHQVLPRLYIGFGHHWRNSDTPGIEAAAKSIGFANLRGVGQLTWSGLMPIVAYDTRDKLIWPSRGVFVRTDAIVYRHAFGSDFDASLYRLDGRWYRRLWAGHVLAVRTVVQRAMGEVPFQRLPALGGPDLFRGWYLGRLRDRALNCNQVESRHTLTSTMAVVGFAALGRVAPTLDDLDLDGVRREVGFRYALNEANRANLRLDVAYGPSLSLLPISGSILVRSPFYTGRVHRDSRPSFRSTHLAVRCEVPLAHSVLHLL